MNQEQVNAMAARNTIGLMLSANTFEALQVFRKVDQQTVKSVSEALKITYDAASKSLRKLYKMGILVEAKDGRNVLYTLNRVRANMYFTLCKELSHYAPAGDEEE